MAHRPGFLIPNASDPIVSYRQAEPDAGDFSILGNDRYGVFYGCTLIPSGLSVALGAGPHIILADGSVTQIPNSGSVTLNTGSTTDRFDLVGWDTVSGGLSVIPGTPVDDPTFAEIPANFVVFAAVLVVAGASSVLPANVIDKRRMLLQGARGAAGADQTFLKNLLPDGGVGFHATGSGALSWSDGAVTLSYAEDEELTVTGKRFHAAAGLTVTGSIEVDGAITATGVFQASNYKRGAGDPNGLSVPGAYGDEYSNTLTGQKYIWRGVSIGWAEIYADEYPPGSVVASLLSGSDAATHMVGWLPLTGLTFNDAQVGRLGTLGAPFTSWNNGDGTWTLPNLSGRTLLGGSIVGQLGGANSVTLFPNNLPPHQHFGGAGTTGDGGGHTHTGTTGVAGDHTHSVSGGAHPHPVDDPGHSHSGNHGNNVPTNFIVAEWGGTNKLDGPFHDASHTWSVGPAIITTIEKTNIVIPTSGTHSHAVSTQGGHTHSVSLTAVAPHAHPFPVESPVGESRPLNTTPAHIAVTYYVKI